MTPARRDQITTGLLHCALVVPALALHAPIWIGYALASGIVQDAVEAVENLPPLTRKTRHDDEVAA